MSLDECMAKHTQRQYEAWMAWLDMQYDRPSRGDAYLMQIACEVRRVLAKKPGGIRLDHFRLKFGGGGGAEEERPKMTLEQAAAASKARWKAMMGKPARVGRIHGGTGA